MPELLYAPKYKVTCSRCDAVLHFVVSEVRKEQYADKHYVICPNCEFEVVVLCAGYLDDDELYAQIRKEYADAGA